MSTEPYTIEAHVIGDDEWYYPRIVETRSAAYACAIREACYGLEARITHHNKVLATWGPRDTRTGFPYYPVELDN